MTLGLRRDDNLKNIDMMETQPQHAFKQKLIIELALN
jgi:hypothetical protein